ncbi:MAG: endonuclease/exonuclease/phosphatase family protein [Dysgonamonadaceae bacterium]|jgi:hypothetical protein|nr:endonuclease/exonuclease/phosphatase family protein [Dysgonamonadaceae bacterium]
MKKLLNLLAVLLLMVPSVMCGQGKKLVPYSVAFYNLENLFDTINNNSQYDLEYSPQGTKKWNSDKYWKKINNMAYAISQLAKETCPLGPAFIGVSEVENRTVLEDLVKNPNLASRNLGIVHYDSPDARGVDVALLYNPAFFTVTSSKPYLFRLADNPKFRSRDQLLVSGLLDGERVNVIVNHWPSRRGGEQASRYLRVAAATLTKHITDSIMAADPDAKIFIMGDLNDDPTNASVSKVLNAKRKKNDVGEFGIFNPMAELFAKGIGSLAYNGGWNLFDQIMLSGNLLGNDHSTLKYWKVEIFNADFLTEQTGRYKGYPLRTHSGDVFLNGYSDHFPVVVYLVKYYNNGE